VWDLAEGAQLGEPLTGHVGWVWGVAVGELENRPVAVSGGDDGTLRVWDLAAGAQRGEPLRGHDGRVWAVAVVELQHRLVVVSGGGDRRLRVWDFAGSQLCVISVESEVRALAGPASTTIIVAANAGVMAMTLSLGVQTH
jgi:WD40 repeat protein